MGRLYRLLGVHDRLLNMSRVSRVYVFSEWAKAVNVRWGADPTKIDVVYPGFPTPAEIDRSRRDEFRFLFVGTDFERKGGFEVVEAFAALSREFPAARLDIDTAANVVAVGRLLRERAPNAFFDERLVKSGRRPLPVYLVGGGGETQVSQGGTTSTRMSTASGVDVLAEALFQAVVAGLLP